MSQLVQLVPIQFTVSEDHRIYLASRRLTCANSKLPSLWSFFSSKFMKVHQTHSISTDSRITRSILMECSDGIIQG
jgi:hypothetical protein